MSPARPQRAPARSGPGRAGTFPAVAAEPAGPGLGSARDRLGREVRLLGALLGQVIAEQAGPDRFALVERVRRRTIALRRAEAGGPGDGREPAEAAGERARLAAELTALDLEAAAAVAKAFTLYFQLVNLADERARIRTLRLRARAARGRPLDDSVGEAVERLAGDLGPDAIRALLARLRVHPVLTAHPTEARRRTLLVALRRIRRLLDELDDPLATPEEDAELRRRLREEITVLWRTGDLRTVAPTPLDEVRSLLAIFDETIFVLVPRFGRAVDRALDRVGGVPRGPRLAADAGRTGTRPVAVPALLRFGSWVGADRDGHPGVTAEVTLEAGRLQADHLLRGYESVALRLMQAVAARIPADALDRATGSRLARDAEELPETMRLLAARFPDEPYRQRLGAIAERLRRTRTALTGASGPRAGAYVGPGAFDVELEAVQASLVGAGLARVAHGELADLRAQVATFGFHLASLEVRQHARVHRRALELLGAGAGPEAEAAPGVSLGEVLATFRAIARLQSRLGPEACRRYVVSFTTGAGDVADVLELARSAADPAPFGGGSVLLADLPPALPGLDIVPLLESAAALEGAGPLLDALLADPAYRAHLRLRGDRQEVMLGYSDSSKESGFLAANWLLHGAQEALVATARRHDVELVLFHGRGGAIGRGGGPANRAILAQAAGSVGGTLKFTEQGEVIAGHYADVRIGERHLEQVAAAALLASAPGREAGVARAAAAGAPLMAELAAASRAAYRALVERPGFGDFFRAATPIGLIAGLGLGSRPAARPDGRPTHPGDELEGLRAIPWVFAWSQARANLPGWYGLGTALEAVATRSGPGSVEALRELYRSWPFLASVLDNAELSLAKADPGTFRSFAALAGGGDAPGILAEIEAEHERSVRMLLLVTGRRRLLEGNPFLARSIELRNPYIDALAALQVELLGRLRGGPGGGAAGARDSAAGGDDAATRAVIGATINGIAAGLRNTG